MKSFISPIYFQTNSISSEKLTGGLLLSSDKKNWLAFSKEKISIAEKLSGQDIKSLLDHTLSLLKNKLSNVNNLIETGKNQLFELNHNFSEEYLSYLNRYSKGVIQFSKPKPIALIPSDEEFKNLYELFVGEPLFMESKKVKTSSFYSKLKLKLDVPGLVEKADIDYTIDPNSVRGILKPAQITLITKNGAIEALQAIDFSNSTKTVVDHIYEFEIIAKHLSEFGKNKNLKNGKYNVVINSPTPGSDQEKLLNNFLESSKNTFAILEIDEVSKIVENIIQNPHTKFSDLIAT